jgi:peptidoglycan/xylan/chitin deacetylase (PgdA/CDA1 family)
MASTHTYPPTTSTYTLYLRAPPLPSPTLQVKEAWDAGHEVATHTVSHSNLEPTFKGSMEDEILEMRDILTEECGLPQDTVVGFRSPYLVSHAGIRSTLHAGGFLYDSTINEHWASATSPSGAQRVWPYTWDKGTPQDCAWNRQECSKDESELRVAEEGPARLGWEAAFAWAMSMLCLPLKALGWL